MARVRLPMGIMSISGKVGDMCFRTMKGSGKTYVIRTPKTRKCAVSEREKAVREEFKRRAKLVSQMQQAGSKLTQKQLWQLAKQAL